MPDRDGPLVEQLTRARDLGFLGPGPVAAQVAHARAFVALLDGVTGRVVDLGSGGGVPGLVVAWDRPDLELVLLDSMVRRTRALEASVDALGLAARVAVRCERAEDAGRGDLRGAAAAVLSRSFGPPAVTAECAAPLLRPGGVLLVSEPPDAVGRWPAAALGQLGLAPQRRTVDPAIQVLEQVAPCPDRFPRRSGVPAKRPLF